MSSVGKGVSGSTPIYDSLREARASLEEALEGRVPELGIVLGSGLGALTERLEEKLEVPYADIPHFPTPTIHGHGGTLVFGKLEKRNVICLSGRSHLYEGCDPAQVVFGVRLLRALGADTLLLTNAAGGFGEGCVPGSLMAIEDHLNLTGCSPLAGPNEDALGPRFPDMSQIYDQELREHLKRLAKTQDLDLANGVYAGVLGPSYETPAEIRMLEALGASAVGMSTVHEAIAAKHMGMRIAGVSCITNFAAGKSDETLNHADVARVAKQAGEDFCSLVAAFVRDLPPLRH